MLNGLIKHKKTKVQNLNQITIDNFTCVLNSHVSF